MIEEIICTIKWKSPRITIHLLLVPFPKKMGSHLNDPCFISSQWPPFSNHLGRHYRRCLFGGTFASGRDAGACRFFPGTRSYQPTRLHKRKKWILICCLTLIFILILILILVLVLILVLSLKSKSHLIYPLIYIYIYIFLSVYLLVMFRWIRSSIQKGIYDS